MNPVDKYYLDKEEPVRSTLLALRGIILKENKELTEGWKYGMPFFCYKGKMFCYLWVHKKYGQPYLGLVEGRRLNHPALLAEKRARMKILLVDPAKDLPLRTIRTVLKAAMQLV